MMSIDKELAFSLDEYQARLDRVRERMEQAGLDLLLIHTPENIYYVSGFQTTGYYVYQALAVPRDRPPVFILRKLERGNVGRYAWCETCVTFTDDEDPVARTAEVVADLGSAEGRIGLEEGSWFLTTSVWRQLQRHLPRASFRDASGLVEALRLIKSPAEVEYLRRAGAITAEAVQAGIEAIHPGARENSIAAAVYHRMLSAGSAYPASPVYVSSGSRTGVAHATWTERAVRPGDVVLFELAANVRRYSAPVMRTAAVAPVPDQVYRLAKASLAGRDAALRALRPGVPSGEVDRACRNAIEEAGAGPYFLHRTGYSVGIGFPPGWGEGHIFDLKPGDPRPLKAGMTLHIVPQLIVDGVVSVGMSACVLVTEAGYEPLVDHPPELVVIGSAES